MHQWVAYRHMGFPCSIYQTNVRVRIDLYTGGTLVAYLAYSLRYPTTHLLVQAYQYLWLVRLNDAYDHSLMLSIPHTLAPMLSWYLQHQLTSRYNLLLIGGFIVLSALHKSLLNMRSLVGYK